MQITEYNLLSQSTNVYPSAPKDRCVRTRVYTRFSACTHVRARVHAHMHERVLRRLLSGG